MKVRRARKKINVEVVSKSVDKFVVLQKAIICNIGFCIPSVSLSVLFSTLARYAMNNLLTKTMLVMNNDHYVFGSGNHWYEKCGPLLFFYHRWWLYLNIIFSCRWEVKEERGGDGTFLKMVGDRKKKRGNFKAEG